MASLKNRRLETLKTMGIESVVMKVSWQLNGTSTALSAQAIGCTLARSDTGLWTVTLPAGSPTCEAVFVSKHVVGAKGGGQTAGVDFETYGAPESGTFGVRVMTMGTTTLIDPAASATVRVNCLAFLATAGTRSRSV